MGTILLEIENSVLKLNGKDFEAFRDWFWEYENQQWDKKIEDDIQTNKLDNLAMKAIVDFKKGSIKKYESFYSIFLGLLL